MTLLEITNEQFSATAAQSAAFDALAALYEAEVERRRDADHTAARLALEVANLRKAVASLTVDDDGCCDGNGIAWTGGEPRACGEHDCSRWHICSQRVLDNLGIADEVASLRGRVADLEAALDAEPCSDCDDDCGGCAA